MTDLLSGITGVLTAIFTGAIMLIEWRRDSGSIDVDWSSEFDANTTIKVTATVRNSSKITIELLTLSVNGPVAQVDGSRKGGKHHSWKPNEMSAHALVEPGGKHVVTAYVFLDVPKMTSAKESPVSWPPEWLSKFFWHSVHMRVPSGMRLNASLRAGRKISAIMTVRFRHTIRISKRKVLDSINPTNSNH